MVSSGVSTHAPEFAVEADDDVELEDPPHRVSTNAIAAPAARMKFRRSKNDWKEAMAALTRIEQPCLSTQEK
jgi:hypothetical protein